jgi:hypothetical protein
VTAENGCKVQDCTKPPRPGKGYCYMHLSRIQRHGTPNPPPRWLNGFWRRVEKTDGCWIWRGAVSSTGYGTVSRKLPTRHKLPAHRVAYEQMVGPIPEELEIDHLCRNKLCVNPAHLEPVLHAENVRRHYAGITHCKRGHERTPENLVVGAGRDGRVRRRSCRRCLNDRKNRYAKAKRKSLAATPDPGQADINAAGRAAVDAALNNKISSEGEEQQ